MMMAQNSMFSGAAAYSNQISHANGMGGAMMPPPMAPMAPPPPPSVMGMLQGHNSGGQFGEAMAARMVSAASTGVGFMGAGLSAMGIAGSLGFGGRLGAMAAGIDPFGMALRAGMGASSMVGGGMGGLAAGGLAAGAVALPLYAGVQYAGALGSNFVGGMQDQMATNAMLRQNFNFMGGSGPFGRGFNQQQMGQIGGMFASEMRGNAFTSMGELNQLTAIGAQTGQFTGVRDVQEFGRKFKEMITTLKSVQRELGGTLTEALDFVNQSKAAGMFQTADKIRFAAGIRNVSASSGIDQAQLAQFASQGAQISRAFGGTGSQGAFGALRGISSVSTALQGGMISEAMLSEATGGRTGTDAMQSFVGDMMAQVGRFSRTTPGRYSIFGLSNSRGTGLDEGSLDRFMSGDVGRGELMRDAHANVRSMGGRAGALRREGMLRGALMEQGGVAGQVGIMRMMLGDRVLDQGDDVAQLVMQRRFGMNRGQAEIMTSLMRNQSTIAQSELSDRRSSSREAEERADRQANRSFDAFFRHLEHSVQDGTGMTAAREMGRRLTTRVSSLVERVANDVLGISSGSGMSAGTSASVDRLLTGRGSDRDRQMFDIIAGRSSSLGGGVDGVAAMRRGMFQTGASLGMKLSDFGIDVLRGGAGGGAMSAAEVAQATNQVRMAQSGTAANDAVRAMMSGMGRGQVLEEIANARLGSSGSSWIGGIEGDSTRRMAIAASAARMGISLGDGAISGADVTNAGRGGRLGLGSTLGAGAMMIGGGMIGSALGPLGTIAGAAAGAGAAAWLFGRAVGGGETDINTEMLTAAANQHRSRLLQGAERRVMRGSYAARTATLSDAQQAQVDAIAGANPEVLARITQSQETKNLLMDAMSTDAGTANSARQRLTALAARATDKDEVAAYKALALQAETAQQRGPAGEAARNRLRQAVVNDPEARAAMGRLQDEGFIFQALAQRGQDNGASRRATSFFRVVGNRLASGNGEEMGQGLSDIDAEIGRISGLRGAEYETALNDIYRVAEGGTQEQRDAVRGLGMRISQQHGQMENLQGRGRRGMRGSRETALSMLTGGNLGELGISVGGRALNANQIAQGIGMRGARGDELRNSLRDQLIRQRGFTEAEANSAVSALGDVYKDGRVDPEEARRISELNRNMGGTLERVAKEQQAAALSNAKARDPIGAEQVRLLTSIESKIGGLAKDGGGSGAGDSTAGAPNNMSVQPST